jgi:catechol 2,3-dioxygenase-like lactoylglutathione lyase family enzyme
MIHLEHINLVVKDIPKTLIFYRAAFPHWRIRDKGQSEWYGKPCNWVHFGDDYQYIAMSDYGEGENRNLKGHQIGLAHFAFVTSNLDAMIERLKKVGFLFHSEGAEEPFRKNIYFLDPAGFEIEFVEYLSDLPSKRNAS